MIKLMIILCSLMYQILFALYVSPLIGKNKIKLYLALRKLDPLMKDIIDLNYGGALGCKSFREEGNCVIVETKAYFDVLYASEDRVFFKKKVFSATLKRRTDIPVDFNFSMTKIACPTCGASFDALKNKNCPYCGNRYESITDDWVLVDLHSL